MKQKALLVNLVFLISINASINVKALTVISDLDDTVKITRVHHISGIYNGLLNTQVFLGMNFLLNSFKDQDVSNKVILVSGSPEKVKPMVLRLINVNKIKIDDLHLVNKTSNKGPKLLKLASEIQDDLVLIGDDQESDPDFYEAIKKQFPDKVKAIYIHQLNPRILPPGQVGFYSAYEIALYEAHAGRLSEDALEKVKQSIISGLDKYPEDPFITFRVSKLLIPTWQKCSQKITESNLLKVSELPLVDHKFLQRVQDTIEQNCNQVD